MNIVSIVNIVLRRFLHNHGNIATEGSPKSELFSTLIEWLQRFFIVHSTIDNTAHSRPLNSLEHCIRTTSMAHITLGRDSKPVPLSFEPQLDRMSHRGLSILYCQQFAFPGESVRIKKNNWYLLTTLTYFYFLIIKKNLYVFYVARIGHTQQQ